MKFLHMSPTRNRQNILKHGLISPKGELWLAGDKESVSLALGLFEDTKEPSVDVFIVTTDRKPYHKSRYGYVTNVHIPPTDVKYLTTLKYSETKGMIGTMQQGRNLLKNLT